MQQAGNYFEQAKHLVDSAAGKMLLWARQIVVEGVIGEAKTLHLLNRCRYRSLELFKLQLFLTASVINLKKLMKGIGINDHEAITSVFVILHISLNLFICISTKLKLKIDEGEYSP